jgi:hypothetical protein
VSIDVEGHRLALYFGEIKTCVQDGFLIEDWYHFEISERRQVLEGSWCVPSRLAARASLPTTHELTDPSPCTMFLRSPP